MMPNTPTQFVRLMRVPMPELPYDDEGRSYVCLYDTRFGDHTLTTLSRNDLVRPEALDEALARFHKKAENAPLLLQDAIAAASLCHKIMLENPESGQLEKQLRVYAWILREVAQHPWLMMVKLPNKPATLHRAPVNSASEFHAWVYDEGQRIVTDAVNEHLQDDPEFAQYVLDHGQRASPGLARLIDRVQST